MLECWDAVITRARGLAVNGKRIKGHVQHLPNLRSRQMFIRFVRIRRPKRGVHLGRVLRVLSCRDIQFLFILNTLCSLAAFMRWMSAGIKMHIDWYYLRQMYIGMPCHCDNTVHKWNIVNGICWTRAGAYNCLEHVSSWAGLQITRPRHMQEFMYHGSSPSMHSWRRTIRWPRK